jgi:hypothetical protein
MLASRRADLVCDADRDCEGVDEAALVSLGFFLALLPDREDNRFSEKFIFCWASKYFVCYPQIVDQGHMIVLHAGELARF